MKMSVCPFCYHEIDDELPYCCGEAGHIEEIDICAICSDDLIEGECPTCHYIEGYENEVKTIKASCNHW